MRINVREMNLSKMKSISIIVPIYYGEKYITGIISQIESCKSYMKEAVYIELVFVNDSPDIPIYIKKKSELIEIVVINCDSNIGIHGARVKGLKYCHGEYVLYLDQDDRIHPEYFSSQLQEIGENEAVVCAAVQAGKPFYTGNYILENMITKDFILKEWNPIISPGQVLLKKDAIPDIWIKNILKNNGADDWFLWLCMMSEGKNFSKNHEVLFEHVEHGTNASGNIMSMVQSEQEVLEIVQREHLFTEEEWRWLLKSYLYKNRLRTRELYNAKVKLDILNNWVYMKEKFTQKLTEYGYKTAAIYGCGVLGNYIYDEIKNIIHVKYFIDQKAKEIHKDIPVYMLKDDLKNVDCVIMTLAGETKDVVEQIQVNLCGKIIILKEWIESMENLERK